jgi:hypothetical protein
MKKVGKIVLFTLVVMGAATVGGYFLLTKGESGTTGEFKSRMAEEQSDLQTERAYQYDIDKSAIVLQTSGEDKNVLNFDQTGVYSVKKSTEARERLDRLIKRSDASTENPIIALNPFGTNPNSLYFYFDTSYRCMVRYTITVEDESISDHVRYVNNGQEENLSKNHEFVISGLVPGRTNYIVVELFDSSGSRREGKTYRYDASSAGLAVQLKSEEGHSKEQADSGLFFVFPSDKNVIAAYDNQGVLRNVTTLEAAYGRRLYRSGDSLLYQIASNRVAKVSALGRVTGVVTVKGYGSIRDFSYDGYNEIYSIGHKKKQDYLLATSFKTGKTRVVYAFPKKMSLKSVDTPSGGALLLETSKPQGQIHMEGITSAKPKVSYVTGKKSAWKKIWKKKKVKKKSEESTDTDDRTRDGHVLQVDKGKGKYGEYDDAGKLIYEFSYGASVKAVRKETLEEICFYGV